MHCWRFCVCFARTAHRRYCGALRVVLTKRVRKIRDNSGCKQLNDVYAFLRGRANYTSMRGEAISNLFWLLIQEDFTLKLSTVKPAETPKQMTRINPSWTNTSELYPVNRSTFAELWKWTGHFDMDLMATSSSAQTVQAADPAAVNRLPFSSCCRTDGSGGVDVRRFDPNNVNRMGGQSIPTVFYLWFPPPVALMAHFVSQHMAECRPRVVIMVCQT